MPPTLKERAKNLGYHVSEENDQIILYSEELVAFVGTDESIQELFNDLERRRSI